MIPSGIQQTVGNLRAGIATLIYAIPLPHLLYEMRHKRDDGGGGAFAGIILLIPRWLLLMAGVMCVIAAGGFNWLRVNRTTLYLLTVLAILSMAVVSFLRFDLPRNPGVVDILIGAVPLHLFTVLTIMVVTLNLNPGLAKSVPLQPVTQTWTLLAAASLLLCGGFVGYQVVKRGVNEVTAVGSRLGRGSELQRQNIAKIPTLDPEADFVELAQRTSSFEPREVREAALARLRTHPEFVARLARELETGTPSSSAAEYALAVVAYATFGPEEQRVLALPARPALERITAYSRSERRYFTKDRRKGAHREVGRLFKEVAAALASTGVDFQPALHEFERTFTDPSVHEQ